MVQKLYKAVMIDGEVTNGMAQWDFFKMIERFTFTFKRFPL
jgi:hypothetical protein